MPVPAKLGTFSGAQPLPEDLRQQAEDLEVARDLDKLVPEKPELSKPRQLSSDVQHIYADDLPEAELLAQTKAPLRLRYPDLLESQTKLYRVAKDGVTTKPQARVQWKRFAEERDIRLYVDSFETAAYYCFRYVP